MHNGFPPSIQKGLQNQGDDLRILIVKTSSLGDLCHSLPAIAHLRAVLPKAQLSWLANIEYKSFLEELAPVDRILSFDRASFRRGPKIPSALNKLRQLISELQKARFHIALDLQGLIRSASFCIGSKAPIRIGPAEAREGTFFYSHRQRSPRFMEHPTHRAFSILESLGITRPKRIPSSFPSSAPISEKITTRFADAELEKPLIFLPGARWSSKTWPATSWKQLISALPEHPILLLGGPDERGLCEELARQTHALSWAGESTLMELPEILRRGRFVVGGDSGPLHLGVMMGRPVLGLYGSTVWRRTYPLGAQNLLLKRADLDCLECRRRSCPVPGHPCMNDLSPKSVASALREALKSASHLTNQ
ncbi:MAG: glycosyltransferase family 9 protein [Planctomycetota bacterium]|nr:glycosyltransferase family 9 protein [Planctomycetota bacterium]